MSDPHYIPVPFPHMVLNSHDVPPPDYEMFNSWKVDAKITPDHMAGWIRKVALGVEGGKLATLIFNSHGNRGAIHTGQGIHMRDLHHFQWLRRNERASLVGEIWIVACEVAGADNNVSGGPDGEDFCYEFAKAALAPVTAGIRKQKAPGPISIPAWHIDDWEGEVYTYLPDRSRIRRQ